MAVKNGRWRPICWQTSSAFVVSSHATGDNAVHTLQDYWIWDAMTRYDSTTKLTASLNVKSLFNKKLYIIFNWYSTYTRAEPRTVNVSLNYTF